MFATRAIDALALATVTLLSGQKCTMSKKGLGSRSRDGTVLDDTGPRLGSRYPCHAPLNIDLKPITVYAIPTADSCDQGLWLNQIHLLFPQSGRISPPVWFRGAAV